MKRNKGSQTKKKKAKGKSVSQDDEGGEKEEVKIPEEDAAEKEAEKEEKEKGSDEDEEEEEEDEDEEEGDKEIDDIKYKCLDLLHSVEYNEFTEPILQSYVQMYNAFDGVHASEKFFIIKCKKLEQRLEKKNEIISSMKKGLELSKTTINNLTKEAEEHHALMDKVQASNFSQKIKMLDMIENFKRTIDQLMIKSELLEEEKVVDEMTGKKKKELLVEFQGLIHTVGNLQKELGESSETNAGLKDQIKFLEDKIDRLTVERDEYLKQLILITKEGHCLMNYLDGLSAKVDKSNKAYISIYKKWLACKEVLQPRIAKSKALKGMKDSFRRSGSADTIDSDDIKDEGGERSTEDVVEDDANSPDSKEDVEEEQQQQQQEEEVEEEEKEDDDVEERFVAEGEEMENDNEEEELIKQEGDNEVEEEKKEEIKPEKSSVKEEKVSVRERESSGAKRDVLDKRFEGLDPEMKRMLEMCIAQRNELRKEIKEKDIELQSLRTSAAKFSQTLESYVKKLQLTGYQKGTLAVERDKLKQTVMGLGKEMELMKRQTDQDRKGMEELMKERDKLSKKLIKCSGQVQEHVKMIQLQEQIITGLETEMEQFVNEANKQRKIIAALERDRDRLITEIAVLTEQVEDTLDEVQFKQSEIAENKKKIAEGETKFRIQQNLFESVRSDRNKYSKLYLESQDEVAELKQKLKIMNHQTEQLKEDITTKETQLSRVQDLKAKCEKEKENVKVELQTAKDELVASAKTIKAMYEEECKLKKHIQNADDERVRLTKEMEQIMNERDILGSQLIRRNDELSLLYEKIRILQSTLNKGEAQYDQRIEDIRLLKLEIKRLRQDKMLLTRSVQNTLDLRREIKYLERDLTQERLKCRALEEELQTPLNIHRWRRLECTDPTSLELIYKIHLLQKRILNQSYTLYQKEDKIQQIERCYIDLQNILRKRPGPETIVILNKTKLALREKTELMKVTIAELNMRDAEVSTYKVDIIRLQDELHEMKKKYYAIKSQHKNCVKPGYMETVTLPKIDESATKIRTCAGGGFCFNAKNKKK